MDLHLVMEKLKPGENVSPDLSSYEAMASKWRGSGTCPSKSECQTAWSEIQNSIPLEIKVQQEVQSLVSQPVMIEALFRAVKYGEKEKLDEVAAIIEQAEEKFSDK